MKKLFLGVMFALLTLSFAFGIQVSGNQTGTWSPANNPYEMIGAVTVPVGSALTIEPGVIVHVMGSYQFLVQGSLSAVGTPADSIRFVNSQSNPTALWPGLKFEETATNNTLTHVYVEYGTYGVRCINAPLNVSNCRFNLCEKGMELYAIGAANPSPVIVEHSLIENCIQNGILISQNSSAIVRYNEIRRNGTGAQFRAAIQLSNQSAGGSNNPLISYNHIHHNYKQGISAWDVANAGAINPQILNNVIEYNYTGVYLLQASGYVADNQINYNFIPGDMNSGAGVMVSGVTSQPYFERNTITGNYTGFYITNNAMPCLGNMAINHAWAQGENIIRANVDANGVTHSVYCYQYANSANIIYAENNLWDTDDEAGIAETINDHNDSAALPTIDFDPWQTYVVPTLVNGSWSYEGAYQIGNTRLQIVSSSTGEILHEVAVETNFAVSLAIAEQFYAVMVADVTSGTRTLYGISGGMLTPEIFSPGDLIETWVGNIEIVDQEPYSYQRVYPSQTIEGQQVYPVFSGFFVYTWDYADWLYRDGDYLMLMKQTRNTPEGIQTWTIPMGQRTWMKIDDVSAGDTWPEVRVIDAQGTLEIAQISAIAIAGTNNQPEGLLYKKEVNGQHMGCRIDTEEQYLINSYDVVFLERSVKRFDYLVEPDGTDFPLVAGNIWIYMPQEPSLTPTDLYYNPTTVSPELHTLHLYWQPPRQNPGEAWSIVRVYRNGEIAWSSTVYDVNGLSYTETLPSTGLAYTYYVTYWTGAQESEPSNTVTIFTTGTDEAAPAPLSLSIYPNPFRGDSGALSIDVRGGKSGTTTLEVYNLRGQLTHRQTVNKERDITLVWNGKDLHGEPCGAGLYLLRLSLPGEKPLQKKVMLVH